MPTIDQINDLKRDAIARGDYKRLYLCYMALAGNPFAALECDKALTAGPMEHRMNEGKCTCEDQSDCGACMPHELGCECPLCDEETEDNGRDDSL